MYYADYLFMLRPPDHIDQQIKGYRQLIIKQAGAFKGMKSGAHLTINSFGRQKPYIMHPAIEKVEKQIAALPPVKLQIDGFRCFDHMDSVTIYAIIRPTLVSDKWLDQLKKLLRQQAKSLVPHITIARTIPTDVFLRVWPYFRYATFKEEFIADHLWILERETFNPNKGYDVYKKIPFTGGGNGFDTLTHF